MYAPVTLPSGASVTCSPVSYVESAGLTRFPSLSDTVQVVSDPKMNKTGVYWSWSNTTGSFENQVSEEVADDGKAAKLYDLSMKLVGLA